MRFQLLMIATLLAGHGAAAVLEGQVVVVGKIPQLKVKAKAFNPYGSVYKENSDTAAAAPRPKHLIVYLEGVPGTYKPPAKNPELAQKDKEFVDDIIPVISGGKVDITNKDTVSHHIRSSQKPWAFNLKKRAPSETATVAFEPKGDERSGIVPIYCDIHSKMRAHVVVLRNPFYAILSEKGGKFSIKGVPPGTYTLNAFHPTLKFEPFKVTVSKSASKPVTLKMLGEKE